MAPHWKGSLPRSKAALLAEELKQRLTGPVLEAFTAAYEMIRINTRFGENDMRNSAHHFSYSVLARLAAPSTPESVIEKAIEQAESGEHGEAILAAIAEGQMSVSDGSRMIECLQSLAKLAESNDWWFIYGQSARPANAA